MPPEPLPWDRKDFFKERKHERSESSSLGFAPRWRDSSSAHYGSSRDFPRWGSSNDFPRRPPGHGKQGGWHLFPEDSGHGGYAPYRSSDKILEEENFRPSFSRGEGKYGRNSRESRGHRDWKGYSWEMSNGSPSLSGSLNDVNNDHRSVDDMLTYPSAHPPHSDLVNTWDQLHLNDHHENVKTGGLNGLGTGQRGDKENSLDWKPLKWTRSGSLSSRGSGFSHSSSSKSLGAADSNEGKTELQPKNVNATPVQSPTGDAAACVTSAAPSEEASRKKPRLGWGEGLAKYEKKKVEGPDLSVNKDGTVVSANNAEQVNSQSLSLADKSPRIMVSPDCTSPVTPSSVACSSSPGLEEKAFGKVNVDNDVSNLCGSPSIGSQSHIEGYPFNLEKLDNSSILNLGSSLMELLQSDDPNSVDSSFVRSTRLNKLLIWKGDISKALEMTESEIDSLENEMKSMLFPSLTGSHFVAASSSFTEDDGKPHSGTVAPSNNITRPSPLEVVSCEDEMMGKIPDCDVSLEENHDGIKNDEIDSPGTATSKFIEPVSLKSESSSDKHEQCSTGVNAVHSVNVELKCSVSSANEEETAVSCNRDDNMFMEGKDDLPPSGDASLHLDEEDSLFNVILASNKECSSKASEVFDKLLPRDKCKVDFSGVTTVSLSHIDSLVREKFAMKKRFRRFKERVVTLKFKAFQHLWKEDMRLLSIRKYRAKSQKKVESNLRMTNSGYQKHRSSIRSRFSSFGNLGLVPTSDILNFTSKLLSVSQAKPYRDVLKMPALILDEKEKTHSRFLSHNGLIEDPWAVEKERAMINPWTVEEKEIFMDKLATCGKDFQKIASFLDHKTTADCVEFYYKNHKSDSFEKIKMGKQCKSSTNYLVHSGKKWNREMNAASLDILGAASVIAADADNAMRSRQMRSGRIFLRGYNEAKISRSHDVERSCNYDILGNEKETVAADVLAGICGSVSSEAMSSCITTSVDLGEGYREQKCQNVESASRRPWTTDVTQNIDEETCSDESCGEMDPADWTDEEKSLFIQAVSSYGKDFAMISKRVRTRSRDQCKVFFSKARKCLGLDLMQPGRGHVGTPVSDDVNGGGSDTEGACAFETGSASSNDKLGSKMDDNSLLVSSAKEGESEAGGRMNLCSDLNGSEVDNDQKDSKVSENLVSDTCQMEQRPAIVDINRKPVNGVCQSEPLQSQKVSVDSFVMRSERDQDAEEGTSSIAESLSTDAVNPVPPDPAVMVKLYPSGISNDIEEREFGLPENNLSSRSVLTQDSRTVETYNHQFLDAGSCTNETLLNDSKHLVTGELVSGEKPCNISLPQENIVVTAKSELDNSSAIQCGKLQNQDRLSSTLDLEEGKQAKRSVNRDENFQHLSGHSALNSDLKAYPIEICAKKEMNGDISCRPFSEVPNPSTSEQSAICQLVPSDCYLQKCSSSKAQHTVPEHPLPSHVIDQSNGHSRSQSDTSKPCRNGDVKLFGKILSNSSSSQISNGSDHENDEKRVLHSKPSSNSSVLKFSGQQSTDDNASLLKFDCNNYLGREGSPMRSYGFWDGNRIQTGLPAMPDSAVLLAKYPAAFSNFHAASSKIEQQALQAAVKSNERNLNGLSVFPPREMNGSSGVLDYQMYRSHDGPKVQPFSVDMTQKVQPFMVDVKQRQDMISEMQKRNGFEAISNLQQQARGMVGMNVIGRGGMLVAGPCATGVSDPVQAIKMHFTKNDQYSSQNGAIMREEESWRGSGDIGR